MPLGHQHITELPASADPIARALWGARRDSRCLEDYNGLSVERADRVAAELYAALERQGDRQVGWKLGATDQRVQTMLGTARPFSAPVFRGSLLSVPAQLLLADFVRPRLEAEIGLVITADGPKPVPCIEIIDCRVAADTLNLAWAIADFGLQGCILFGDGAPDPIDVAAVEVTVSVDGREVVTGSGNLTAAVHALASLRADRGPDAPAVGHHVATGSLIDALPLDVGHWTVDFGELGTLSMEVAP